MFLRSRSLWNIAVCVSILFGMLGCSKSGDSPVVPSVTTDCSVMSAGSNHHLWGVWDVYISADRSSVEITPLRTASMHVNTVKLLETPHWSTNLVINNIHVVEPKILEADVKLTHPYPGFPVFTGFDVRGIFIAQSDFIFPAGGRIAGIGDSVPHMLNPDGYTSVFNPTEFPQTGPELPVFKYYPGKYATGGDLSATLCPFLAYRRDAERRMFEAGGSETRTFRIYAPPGPIHFGYAVDACWEPVDIVVDPLTDFPPEANCLEAYYINVTLEDSNSSVGSSVPVSVEVFDHQGSETISAVSLEAPDLFTGESALIFSGQTGNDSCLFTGTVTNELGAIWGDYPMLVRVIDTAVDPNLGAIDAFNIGNVHVKQGWARSWGGNFWNRSEGVALDGSGNILVAGMFDGDADLNPGEGEDIHHSNGSYDSTLCKFDSNGVYLWGRNWGGDGSCESYGTTIDSSGNSYVIGFFTDTADFDPGAGVETRTANGDWDMFITKLSPDGNFLWVRTWSSEDWIYSTSVSVSNSGGVYLAGHFQGTIDFDPTSGEDFRTSSVAGDGMLIKLDVGGNFHWVRTWGPKTFAICAAPDNFGNVFVTGSFSKTVDFDPGTSEDLHTPVGTGDAFLTCFNSNGDYLGARTWGGSEGITECTAVAVSGNGVYVAGLFGGTIDLDPGPGEDIHVSSSSFRDAYLSKFNTLGIFQWAKSFGGTSEEWAQAVSAGPTGVYVIGGFAGTVDFDPGPGIDEHTAGSTRHMYLTYFDPSGNFQWANTWDTGTQAINDGSRSVCSTADGVAYLAGCFSGPVDFDPTSGVDLHSSPGPGQYRAFISKNLPDGTW